MKTVLIAVLVQALPLPATDTEPAAVVIISTPVTADYDDMDACTNAARLVMKSAGSKLLNFQWSCAPKAIGQLEVEKPKAKPQSRQPPEGAERGTAS